MVQTLRKAPWTAELYARAVAGAVLPGFVWGGGDTLPTGGLRLADVRFTPGQIEAYRAVCTGPDGALPPAMPHLPGFPLALRLMTARDFPMSALGMVHIANRITVHAPLSPDAAYDIEVDLADPRQHSKGTQFDAVTIARRDGRVVWRETSTYLSRGTRLSDAGPPAQKIEWPAPGEGASTLTVDVPGDIGRRYASVSGDRNPIHLHSMSARAFGFRSAIAHGMWTMARCLAEVEAELPGTYSVASAFFKPVFLPAHCEVHVQREAPQWRLWLTTGDTVHVAMMIGQDHTRTT